MPWTLASLATAGSSCFWVDPSDLATLFQDTGAATPVTADNQPVGRCNTKPGAGAAACNPFQGTASAQPKYRTASGLHWLEFDGGDWLDTGLTRFGSAGLHCGPGEAWTVFIGWTGGIGSAIARNGGTTANATFQLYNFTSASPDFRVIARGRVTQWTATPDESPYLVAARWDGTTLTLRHRNGTQTVSVGTAAEETAQRIILGARTNGTGNFFAAGNRLWQAFAIDRAVTDTELDYGLFFLAQKAGVSGVGVNPDAALAGQATGGATASGSLSGSAAQLDGQALGSAIASGVLTSSSTPLAGAALGSGSAAGTLTGQPTLSGAASSSATASATLAPASGELAGTATASGTASATLTGSSAPLAGAALGSVSAAGALTDQPTLSGAAAGGAIATATLAPVAEFTISSPADRGNLDLPACAFSGSGDAAIIDLQVRAIYNEWSASAINYAVHGRVDGVQGKRPTFRMRTDRLYSPGSTERFWWSYDGATWQRFDTRASGTGYIDVRNNTAFSQDTIYIGRCLVWNVARSYQWLADNLIGQAYVSMPPSSAGNAHVYDYTGTRTTEQGATVPSLPLHSFKITDAAATQPDGSPKWLMVLLSGVHAAEDWAFQTLTGALNFLRSADPKAAWLRAHFVILVYPVINPSGRYGGDWRNDFDPAHPAYDANRYWFSDALVSTAKARAAILADLGGVAPRVWMDFHGEAGTTSDDYVSTAGRIRRASWSQFRAAYYPAQTDNDTAISGTSTNWGVTGLGAWLGVTPESALAWGTSPADYEAWGAAHMKILADMGQAGLFNELEGQAAGTATATATLSGAAAQLAGESQGTGSVTATLTGASAPLVGSALGVGTATGELLGTAADLSGAAIASGNAAATLTEAAVALTGAAQGGGQAAGTINLSGHDLAGSGQGCAEAVGELSVTVPDVIPAARRRRTATYSRRPTYTE